MKEWLLMTNMNTELLNIEGALAYRSALIFIDAVYFALSLNLTDVNYCTCMHVNGMLHC